MSDQIFATSKTNSEVTLLFELFDYPSIHDDFSNYKKIADNTGMSNKVYILRLEQHGADFSNIFSEMTPKRPHGVGNFIGNLSTKSRGKGFQVKNKLCQ